MRTFEIVGVWGRRKKPVAWFFYDEEQGTATIDIAKDARRGHVPAMFNHYIEVGDLHIDEEWTEKWISERVPPESRHNIDEILTCAGLDEYDPILLLLQNEGRSCQDDFYLREIPPANSPAGGYASDETQPTLHLSTEESRFEYAFVTLKQSLGERLCTARKKAGLTQQDLSYRTGIQQSIISKIEHGRANPTLETLTCIACALDIELEITLR